MSVALLAGVAEGFGASSEVQKVTDGVYTLVGQLGQRSAKNLDNNATFGVIITNEGIVLVDPGGTCMDARGLTEDEVVGGTQRSTMEQLT